jgi:uroporphyrinogen-III synthase
MAKSSLAGLKILVTRPRDQALPLAQMIESAGGKALLFPLLDIAPVLDADALQQQVSHLPLANLAIFISPNAVQYGMKAIAAAEISINAAENAGLKIATVGQGSAKALRELGVANVLVPTAHYDSEGLLALPQLQAIAGWRVMIFRGDGGRELLGDTLKARGASVEYVSCYLRSKPQQPASCLLNELPDAITVTSSEALAYLWQMLDVAAQVKLRDIPLFLPHPRINALAQTQGWQRVHLTESGDEGLLTGLQDWAKKQDRDRKGLPRTTNETSTELLREGLRIGSGIYE